MNGQQLRALIREVADTIADPDPAAVADKVLGLTERIRARRNTSRPAPTLPARPAETSAPASARRGGAGRGAPKSA